MFVRQSEHSHSRCSDASVTLLASCVPDLHLQSFAIHFFSSAQHKHQEQSPASLSVVA